MSGSLILDKIVADIKALVEEAEREDATKPQRVRLSTGVRPSKDTG